MSLLLLFGGAGAPATIEDKASPDGFVTRRIRNRRALSAPAVPASVGIPPTPDQWPARHLLTVTRRHGWRKRRDLPELDVYPRTAYPDAPTNPTGFVTRSIRGRRLQTAPDVPISGSPPPAPEFSIAAVVQHRVNRRTDRRRDIEVIEFLAASRAEPLEAWRTPEQRRRRQIARHVRRAPEVAEFLPAPTPFVEPVTAHGMPLIKKRHKLKKNEREQIEQTVQAAIDALEGVAPASVVEQARKEARREVRQIVTDYTVYEDAIRAAQQIIDLLRIQLEAYERERDDEETLLLLL